MRSIRGQAGDTIVEVLIAIAVISTVLGGAYAIAQRTLTNSRQAQEHGEALQFATEQVELLSQRVSADPSLLNDLKSRTSFCYVSTAADPVERCENTTGGDYSYTTTVIYTNNSYFKTTVTWPSPTGNGDDTVTLAYRPYTP